MNAWARYGKYDPHAAQNAEELISVMYDMDAERGEEEEGGSGIRPTAQTYSIAMNAWAKAREGPTAEGTDCGEDGGSKVANARRLLDCMLEKYEAGEEEMKPGVFAYTSVLSAAAYSRPDGSPTPPTTRRAVVVKVVTPKAPSKLPCARFRK